MSSFTVKDMGILIGFEVGTGRPVHVDPDHLLITGQTRMAGKTVTLNALVSRSRRRAIAFRTKRGEMAFDAVNVLKPFYREPKAQRSKYISWQYVKSILEASQGRGMNFEEAWIIRACDGASDLNDIYENIRQLQSKARRGIDENQYLKLTAYFDIILPQLKEREFSSKLKLKKGINLMDLEPLTFEMRCLVMERTISYVMEQMKDVVIMLPEGWKYVPERLTTPVKAAAIGMAREGASILNHVWVDSQDLRGLDKQLVGQCTTWFLGVQVEENEAKRTRVSLGNRVRVRDIQGLKLGHFYLRNKDNELIHVYVLPAGVPEEMGQRVALGEIPVSDVSDYLTRAREGEIKDEEEMYRRENEELRREIEELRRRLEEISSEDVNATGLNGLQTTVGELQLRVDGLQDEVHRLEGKAEETAARNRQLEEGKAGLEKEVDDLRGQVNGVADLRKALRRIIGPLEAPPVTVEEGPSETEIVAMVDDRLKQVLAELPEGRFVSVDLPERFREIIREDFVAMLAEKIQDLTEEPRRTAVIVHEHRDIKSSELYYMVRGKATTGRIPVNFYNTLKKLEDAHLVTRQSSSGLVTWSLGNFVDGKLIDLYDEETRSQIKSYLASLLLP